MSDAFIHFDSRDRDKSLYPTSSTFFVPFPEKVQSSIPGYLAADVTLVGCEMANVTNSITLDNCTVSWQHKSGSNPIYTTQISTGTYTFNSLCTQLLNTLNAVARQPSDPIFQDDPANAPLNAQHRWALVYASSPDNGLTLSSLYLTQNGLDANAALQVAVGSTSMVCSMQNHGLNVNDNISIQGVVAQVGGLPPSAYINTTFQVATVIDASHFTVQLSQGAYEDYSVGLTDEPTMSIGRPIAYKFLATSTLLPTIGFPTQSGVIVGHLRELANAITQWADGDRSVSTLTLPWLPDQVCLVNGQFTFDASEAIGLPNTAIFRCLDATQKNFYVEANDLLNAAMRIASDASIGIPDEEASRLMVISDAAYNRSQTNVLSNGSLYSSVNLSGATHCFLTSPQCRTPLNPSGTIAKIQMVAASGYLNFNNIIGQNTPLLRTRSSRRTGLLLQFLDDTMQKNVYNYGLDISGTLKLSPGWGRNTR